MLPITSTLVTSSKHATFDIESERIPTIGGILAIRKIFCINIKINDQPVQRFTHLYHPTSSGNLRAAVTLLNSCDYIIGHNILGFDIPVIENCIGKLTATPIDTLIIAQLMYSKDTLIAIDYGIPEMPKPNFGSFSLKAFGIRFGNYKIQFEDFSRLTTEMLEYCDQDVELTYQLLQYLLGESFFPNPSVIYLETRVKQIIMDQELYGFYFDIDGAKALATTLRYKKLSLEISLQKSFKPMFLPNGPIKQPSSRNKIKQYAPSLTYRDKFRYAQPYWSPLSRAKNGKLKFPAKTKFKWFSSPHYLYYEHKLGEYQPIALTRFNPGSRANIQLWLKKLYDWKPIEYTPSGSPKVDADTLEILDYPEANQLKEYLKLTKDLGQLVEGDNSLLNVVGPDSRFHGRVNTLGANTGRMTHSSPNITQVNKTKEFRSLLQSSPGYDFIDVDADQLELVMMGHYLGPYDNYQYAIAVDSGDKDLGTDIHTLNQKAAKLPTRDAAKTFIYGYLYGSGATRIGWGLWTDKTESTLAYTFEEYSRAEQSILKRIELSRNKGDVVETEDGQVLFPIAKDRMIPYTDTLIKQSVYGTQIATEFRKQTLGLDALIKDIQSKAKAGELKGFKDYQLHCRSPHSAFNLLLQAGGAIYMKQYLYEIDQDLRAKFTHGIDFGYVANIHDAVNIECKPEFTPEICTILREGFAKASIALGMKYHVKGKPSVGHNQWETH